MDPSFSGSYHDVIDNMGLALVIYRAVDDGDDFMFIEVNHGVEKIEQVKREDLIGKRVTETFPGVVEFELLDVLKRVYRTGAPERLPIGLYVDDRITGWRDNYVYKLDTGEVVAVYRDETVRKKQEERIKYLNQVLRAIRNVNQIIATEKDRGTFLQRCCESMVETKGYNGAWIGLTGNEGTVKSIYGAGFDEPRFSLFKERVIQGVCPHMDYVGEPGVLVVDDVAGSCVGCPLQIDGLESNVLCASLMHEGRLYGLMMASVPVGMVLQEELGLFEEVVSDISFALHGMEVEEERKRVEKYLEKRSHDLAERVKELNCLYKLSQLLNQQDTSLDEVISEINELIIAACQYPEIICSRISVNEVCLSSERFMETEWGMSTDIVVNGTSVGKIEVYYLEEMPVVDEGPFLREERKLIDAIAASVGTSIMLRQKHENLVESEMRYRGLIEDSPVAVSVTVAGEIVYVSPERLRLTGHQSKEELIGTPGIELVGSEDKERIQARIEARRRGEQVSSITSFNLRRVNGEIIHVIDYMSTILWEGKKAVMHILQDITKQVQYETRLETLHRYAAALASSETMDEVADITRDSLNDVVGFYVGALGLVEGDNLVTRYIWGVDLLEPFTLPLDGPGITVKAVNTGKTLNLGDIRNNSLYVKGYADQKMGSELAVPVKDSGKVVAVINLESEVRDAFSEEDQRLVETLASHIASVYSKIKYSEKLNQLYGLTLDLSLVGSVDEVIELSFSILRKVLGFQFVSFQMLEDEGLVTIGIDGRPSLGMVLPLTGKGITTRAAREARTVLINDVRLDPDFIKGSTDSRSELAVPIIVENNVLGVLNVESLHLNAFTDEDVKLMEVLAQNVGATLFRIHAAEAKLELERAHARVKQAEELGMLKTRFMSTATHELRTPLSSIQGYTELVQDDLDHLSESQRQYFTVIQRNVQRLTKLTDDLLDQQRLEEERLSLTFEPVNVSELVEIVSGEFLPILAVKHQTLRVNSVDVVVDMDRLRIMQVLVNLLSNASKFSPENCEVVVDVVETGDGVRFSVVDEGVGIREEDMGRLFTPFPGIRVEGVKDSTGLGLSICKGIVKLHGGRIWAESPGLGAGSSFSFTLPKERGEDNA